MKTGTGKTFERILQKLIRGGILLACLPMLVSCSAITERFTQNTAATEPQQQETLVSVTRGSVSASQSFVGNLEYSQSAVLTWKTDGVISEVRVKVGDQVKKGDILAVLETGSLSPSVILAEKTMIEQQENLEDVKASETARMNAYKTLKQKESALITAKLQQEALYYPRATKQEMELAWDSLALANLNFNYAKQDYDHLLEANVGWEGSEEGHWVYRFGRAYFTGVDRRSARERKFEDYVSAYNKLVSAYEKYQWVAGEPSDSDYAIAEGNVRMAQIEYDKALEDYNSYKNGPREKDVFAAEISLNNAETNYNQRFIIAQFDGTVTSVSAVEGYYVTRGSTALRLDDMSRIFIPINIPELDLTTVSDGSSVSITLDAIAGKTCSGHILSIADAGTAGENTSSFSARVEIDDPDPRMLAGLTAEVTVPLKAKENALLVPNEAITYTNGIPQVTVVSENVRQTLEIQTGIITDSVTEVTSSNLQEGQQLAVIGEISPNAPGTGYPDRPTGSTDGNQDRTRPVIPSGSTDGSQNRTNPEIPPGSTDSNQERTRPENPSGSADSGQERTRPENPSGATDSSQERTRPEIPSGSADSSQGRTRPEIPSGSTDSSQERTRPENPSESTDGSQDRTRPENPSGSTENERQNKNGS